jgi:hypothetical protein
MKSDETFLHWTTRQNEVQMKVFFLLKVEPIYLPTNEQVRFRQTLQKFSVVLFTYVTGGLTTATSFNIYSQITSNNRLT